MKELYIYICIAIFYFIQMLLFLICQVLGAYHFAQFYLLREGLFLLKGWEIFCRFMIFFIKLTLLSLISAEIYNPPPQVKH